MHLLPSASPVVRSTFLYISPRRSLPRRSSRSPPFMKRMVKSRTPPFLPALLPSHSSCSSKSSCRTTSWLEYAMASYLPEDRKANRYNRCRLVALELDGAQIRRQEETQMSQQTSDFEVMLARAPETVHHHSTCAVAALSASSP